ncbi:MAG: UDP-2,3-diacylglucosamine diphosphatase LpxI [Litoreibacter sp.]|uniref:LpxI family protein n=1 Tax=Litoreibacter sp. TaxID=1969459 RepID=UPI00329756AB
MLALVTGEGELPKTLMEHLRDTGTPYHLCQMEWQDADARDNQPVKRFRIETLGSFIEWLKDVGVDRICFAGRVDRPPLDPSKIDPQTMPLVPRMMQALQLGDDAALRLVLGFFEEAGIQPVGAHEVRPDVLPAVGVLTAKQPSDENKRDADRAVQIIGAMAAADVGQACIVQKGQALAIEAQPGTDYMMQSVLNARLPLPWAKNPMGISPQSRAKGIPKAGGVLVKAAKPGQELRIDMPTIGPDTILRAIQVGLDGIIVEAGRVIILNCDDCVKLADSNNLFIWVRG